MSVHVPDYRDPDVKVIYMSPLTYGALFLGLLILILGLAFHEAVGDWFAGMRQSSPNSLRGEWVGELNVPHLNDEYIHTIHKRAVIRFTLNVTEHYLQKYGGTGEVTISGEAPQPIEIKDLWPSGTGPEKTFETGIWKVPYKIGDPGDRISGGFQGTFQTGVLTLKRQTDTGYEMEGSLRKGTDQTYNDLVQKMNAQPTH